MDPIETRIVDQTLTFREEIYSRNIRIDDIIVSISYKYHQPHTAHYDPKFSFDTIMEEDRFVTMTKTLLNYVNEKIPTITEVNFQDDSNIECDVIPLYYFSIAFNGKTWYEKHFNAKQKDSDKHTAYRAKIEYLLHSIDLKSNTPFLQFLRIAMPPVDIIDELQTYYEESNTFGKFFQSIPKDQRCKLVRDWIATFMVYYLEDKFSNSNWIIELPIRMAGGRKRTTKKYYCPKGRISCNKTYRNFGIDPNDVWEW